MNEPVSKISDETIDEGVAHMSVLLNRVQWLDPARAQVQRDVWRSLVKAIYPKTTVVFSDVLTAIRSTPPPALPLDFITEACRIADRRHHEVSRLIDDIDAGKGLVDEAIKYQNRRRGGIDTSDDLRTAHRRAVAMLWDSFPHEQAQGYVTKLDTWLDWMLSLDIPAIAPPTAEDDAAADAFWKSWRDGNQ